MGGLAGCPGGHREGSGAAAHWHVGAGAQAAGGAARHGSDRRGLRDPLTELFCMYI